MWLLRLGDHLSRLALRMSGFESRTISTHNGQVHYYTAEGHGSGPPIVFVHGIGANASHWGPILLPLRRNTRRIYAIDLLGHGFSESPDPLDPYALFGALGDSIEALTDEPVVLVGNSLGGGLSLAFSMMRPERVAKLLLLSPGGAWMEPEAFLTFADQFRMKSLSIARDFVSRLYGRAPLYAPLLSIFVQLTFHRPPLRALVDRLSVDILHTPETLAALRVPAHILWGKGDRVLPRENLDYFKKHLTVAVTEPEVIGHCPQIEAPRLTVRWIREAMA
jgi:pimeloyl-ACP methyl ester carboxylesterase